MTETEKNSAAPAGYEMMRSLGGVVGTSCRMAKDLGKSIEDSCRSLTAKTSGLLSWRARREEPALPEPVEQPVVEEKLPEEEAPDLRDEIRTIVAEELARARTAEPCGTVAAVEKRLRLMADTMDAIQKRMVELSAHGVEQEDLVSNAMAWVDNVNLLNDGERALLTTIFRQNMALQKPQRARATGDTKKKAVPPRVQAAVQSEVG